MRRFLSPRCLLKRGLFFWRKKSVIICYVWWVSHHLSRLNCLMDRARLRSMFAVCTTRFSRNGLGIQLDGSSTTTFIDSCASVDQRRCFWHRSSDVHRNGCGYIYTFTSASVDSKKTNSLDGLKIVNGAAAQSKRLTTPTVLPLQTWTSYVEGTPSEGDSERGCCILDPRE